MVEMNAMPMRLTRRMTTNDEARGGQTKKKENWGESYIALVVKIVLLTNGIVVTRVLSEA